jgi:hypothetical protein
MGSVRILGYAVHLGLASAALEERPQRRPVRQRSTVWRRDERREQSAACEGERVRKILNGRTILQKPENPPFSIPCMQSSCAFLCAPTSFSCHRFRAIPLDLDIASPCAKGSSQTGNRQLDTCCVKPPERALRSAVRPRPGPSSARLGASSRSHSRAAIGPFLGRSLPLQTRDPHSRQLSTARMPMPLDRRPDGPAPARAGSC